MILLMTIAIALVGAFFGFLASIPVPYDVPGASPKVLKA